MNLPRIALNVTSRTYAKLVELGNRVHTALTGNATYTTPTPSLTILQTAITDVDNAITARGSKTSHGSTGDVVDLRQKSRTLYLLLKAMLQYVSNTAEQAASTDYGLMESLLVSSGFDLVHARTPVGVLQPVRDLRIFVDRSLNKNEAKIRWRRPENTTSRKDVLGYNVYKGTTPDFSAAARVATITRTEYLDTNTSNTPATWYFWIVPFNTAGPGATSDSVTVPVWGA